MRSDRDQNSQGQNKMINNNHFEIIVHYIPNTPNYKLLHSLFISIELGILIELPLNRILGSQLI